MENVNNSTTTHNKSADSKKIVAISLETFHFLGEVFKDSGVDFRVGFSNDTLMKSGSSTHLENIDQQVLCNLQALLSLYEIYF